MSIKFKPTRLYIKRHTGTGKLYFGKTVVKNIVKYKGSGDYWTDHIMKHGTHLVVNDWVSDWFYSDKDIESFALAFSEIFDIVESPQWANMKPENGLDGGYNADGWVTAKDSMGNLIGRVSTDDPRFATGEITGFFKHLVPVKDKEGNTYRVPKTDPRYLSGELVGVNTGTLPAKDRAGVKLGRIPLSDPRWATGEIVSLQTGSAYAVDRAGNKLGRISSDDPRWATGEIIKGGATPAVYTPRTCPHCGRTGRGANMGRYHFDNCKHRQVSSY